MEKDMEHSFAVARSKDKTCGICFEVITEKTNRSEHRFGILPNCYHIFCLPCIRKWRQAKNFDSTITRACPECRVESHYVCPSLYWVETKEEKEKLLTEYKQALQQQNCKYFNRVCVWTIWFRNIRLCCYLKYDLSAMKWSKLTFKFKLNRKMIINKMKMIFIF